MAKLKDVIYLSNEDYDTLVSTGTVTIDGDVLTYDESNVYITPEVMASSSQDGLMSAADKVKLDGIEAEMANYLPLTGGTLSLANSDSLKIKRTAASSGAFITYYNNNQDTNKWQVGMASSNSFAFLYNNAAKAEVTASGDIYENGTALVNKYGRLASANTWTADNIFNTNVAVNGYHRDKYYASNVCRHFYTGTPTEFVIKTKIVYASGAYMPVIRIYGYAYGEQSPIELRVGFYIYGDNLGWAGAVSTGAWQPKVYLFRYTENSTNYVAVGFKGACYFCGFQVDVQAGATGQIGYNGLNPGGWTTTHNGADTSVSIIPAVGTDKCVEVAYKAMSTSITGSSTNSSKLNGQEASYYLNYNNFTNKPTLGTAAAANTGTSSGNVPVLDSNGKLNSSVVPAIAITDTFVVNSQSAMLALSAQVGDICVRTDLKKSFILKTAGASTLANWQELLTPTDAVSSVNGKTGAVTLSASDVGALPSSTTFVSSVNGASGAITNVAKTNTANTFTGNNVFSGAFSATDGGSISDSSGTSLSVAGGSIDIFADSGVNITSSSRGYISAAEPIRYTTGVGPIESQDLVQKSYVDNKTYATSIATSSGTNQLTLAFGTKYALTAGGTSYVFTMPSNPNTNQTVKAGSTTFGANAAVTIAAGTRITVTPNATNNTITIATSATADSAITNAQIDGLF